MRAHIASNPRPINNTKVYGGANGGWGGAEEGTQKFWRNIFGGSASSRFHRPFTRADIPQPGLGLSAPAQAHIRSMRMLTDELGIFTTEPRNDLLSDRDPNEAYLLADPGRAYAVYVPDGGSVSLDLSHASGTFEVRWLDIAESRWLPPESLTGGGAVRLEAPGSAHRAVLIRRTE